MDPLVSGILITVVGGIVLALVLWCGNKGWRWVRNLDRLEKLKNELNEQCEKVDLLQSETSDLRRQNKELKELFDSKSSLFPSDIIFVEKIGAWYSSSAKLYYCNSCKIKERFSPLRATREGWQCTVKDCGQWYQNPDFIYPHTREVNDWDPFQ